MKCREVAGSQLSAGLQLISVHRDTVEFIDQVRAWVLSNQHTQVLRQTGSACGMFRSAAAGPDNLLLDEGLQAREALLHRTEQQNCANRLPRAVLFRVVIPDSLFLGIVSAISAEAHSGTRTSTYRRAGAGRWRWCCTSGACRCQLCCRWRRRGVCISDALPLTNQAEL